MIVHEKKKQKWEERSLARSAPPAVPVAGTALYWTVMAKRLLLLAALACAVGSVSPAPCLVESIWKLGKRIHSFEIHFFVEMTLTAMD